MTIKFFAHHYASSVYSAGHYSVFTVQ